MQLSTGIDEEYINEERDYQLQEIARRQELFRAARPQAPMAGRSIILTDDGIATGSTMMAALHVVNAQEPHETIVAVPVAPPERLKVIRQLCDRLICLLAPPDFYAVGQWYESFVPVEDEEAIRLLREFGRTVHHPG